MILGQGGIMTPVIRVDDEVMAELKERAISLDLVFRPPNAVFRVILGLDSAAKYLTAASSAPVEKHPRFGTDRVAIAVKDTTTGKVYPSKYKAGLAFVREFPDTKKGYLWYKATHRYPGRFVEVSKAASYLDIKVAKETDKPRDRIDY
jgi:hypothetical protein